MCCTIRHSARCTATHQGESALPRPPSACHVTRHRIYAADLPRQKGSIRTQVLQSQFNHPLASMSRIMSPKRLQGVRPPRRPERARRAEDRTCCYCRTPTAFGFPPRLTTRWGHRGRASSRPRFTSRDARFDGVPASRTSCGGIVWHLTNAMLVVTYLANRRVLVRPTSGRGVRFRSEWDRTL